MRNFNKYCVNRNTSIKDTLNIMNNNELKSLLFITDKVGALVGSVSDGDIRRGIINGIKLSDNIEKISKKNPRFLSKENYDINTIISLRKNDLKLLPIIDKQKKIISILNFKKNKSFLPIDTVIMAGGRGERLKPLTDNTPKPMLKINNQPICEYLIDNLSYNGINDFWISVNYKGEKIKKYFGNGFKKNIDIKYIDEDKPLGTIGSVRLINKYKNDHLLIHNSDIICNVDYEDFYKDFLDRKADLAILTIPYKISVPYAVIESKNNIIKSFEEKPTIDLESNGGIYLAKKEVINLIPKNKFFNATDLIDVALTNKLKVVSYPFIGYWLDIGNPIDFEKGKREINQVKFL